MQKITNEDLGRPTPAVFSGLPKMQIVVVLDNVRSLNNVGSFFRTCDAFPVEKIILCGITACPPDKEIHKTALGAENTVAWEYSKSTIEAIGALKSSGYRIIGVEQAEGAVMLQDFECAHDGKYALIFGNEVFGVSQEVMDACDSAIEIPQGGTKHSLNVSVSAGVVLWHFFSRLVL